MSNNSDRKIYEAKVWEMPSGNLIATLKHDGAVSSVTFSPDGKLLATGSYDNTAKVWEMPSGKLIATIRHDWIVDSVSFSPDGKLLATLVDLSDTAKVWEMPYGKLIATLKHDGRVTSVTFSPDGRLLATGSVDHTAKVWEMPSGKLIATLKHYGYVYSVTFSSDGKLLATMSNNSYIYEAKVWEVLSGNLIATLKHDDYLRSVTLSPDGNLLAMVSSDNNIAKVWEIPWGNLIATLKHDGGVNSVTFSPDGKLLATGSYDNTAKVWEMPNGNLIATLKHDGWVTSVSFSPDGKLLATMSNTAKVWEMPNGRLIATLRHDDVTSVTFSPNGSLLATGSDWPDSTAKVWAPNTADTPILIQPPDGSKFVDTFPELKWEKVTNVCRYQVQVAKDKDFSQVVLEASTETESLKVNMGYLVPGTYFWRARTMGWVDFGKWSEPRSCTVDFCQKNVICPILNVTQTGFTVEIKMEKAQKLYGFQFDLKFDPNVLEAIRVTEGDLLKSIGGNTSFLKPSIDNNAGIIKNVACTRMSPGEVSGFGVLAKIEFKFKIASTSPIEFTLVKLSNEQFQPIPFAYVNGSATLRITTSAKFKVQPSIVDNQVVAKVLIENAIQLRGYSVDLEYSSALELLDMKQGEFLKENWAQTTSLANTFRLNASKAKGEFVEGSGEIATLTLRIWEGGEISFILKNGSLTAPDVANIIIPELEGGKITVVASPNWEVNKDYVVDTQDIVILGINIDKKITGNPRPNPDVTRDGLVDLFDLVAVGSHYADEYSAVPQPPAAPLIVKRDMQSLPAPTAIQRAILQNLYEKIKDYPDTDASVVAVKRLLLILLKGRQALPKETRLAQNYPNPFNPETWVPFELSQDADVTINIYDAKGRLVRTLSLGRKPAGYYLSKDSAAYWNGRNTNGERVSSGLYFYTLKAGEFTMTKKLVVVK
jgi:WD40 repeat protein